MRSRSVGSQPRSDQTTRRSLDRRLDYCEYQQQIAQRRPPSGFRRTSQSRFDSWDQQSNSSPQTHPDENAFSVQISLKQLSRRIIFQELEPMAEGVSISYDGLHVH